MWRLEGVEAPHDVALVAAPLRLAGRERPLAVLVGETRPSGSRLHKFLLLPPGRGFLSAVMPCLQHTGRMTFPMLANVAMACQLVLYMCFRQLTHHDGTPGGSCL